MGFYICKVEFESIHNLKFAWKKISLKMLRGEVLMGPVFDLELIFVQMYPGNRWENTMFGWRQLVNKDLRAKLTTS